MKATRIVFMVTFQDGSIKNFDSYNEAFICAKEENGTLGETYKEIEMEKVGGTLTVSSCMTCGDIFKHLNDREVDFCSFDCYHEGDELLKEEIELLNEDRKEVL